MLGMYLSSSARHPYRLLVLNVALEVIFAWPDAATRSSYALSAHPWAQDITHAWMPCGTLVAAVRPTGTHKAMPHQLDVCWHPCKVEPGSAAASNRANGLLVDIGPDEELVSLFWGGLHGLAAVTDTTRQMSQRSGRLYVWMPDSCMTSMALQGYVDPERQAVAEWSPAGDRLLLRSSGVQLVSTSCTLLLHLPGQNKAAFCPDGRHLAVVHQPNLEAGKAWGLEQFMTFDSAKVFSRMIENLSSCWSMTISSLGHQVIMWDGDATLYVVQFGQAITGSSGSDICKAVAAACKFISP